MINRLISGKTLTSVLVVFVLAALFPDFARAVVYVDRSRSGGNGTSWSAAYKTLEAAIAGSGGYQEFWVADGTYKPASPLVPKEGSKFYGGFSGNESTLTARDIAGFQTIIDGQLKLMHGFDIHVADVRLDGFKIQNCFANNGVDGHGGGVSVTNSSTLVIANCTFLNNSSSSTGGGLFIYNSSAVKIENCLFARNSSGVGGAIHSYNSDIIVSFCIFNNNLANLGEKRGGAIRAYSKSVQINSCIFTGNMAEQGGAVELNDNTGSVIQCSEFKSNRAESADPARGAGGAIALLKVSIESSVSIRQCLFQENVSSLEGGSLWSYWVPVLIQDSNFVGNRAVNGGALMLDYKTNRQNTVQRCLFSGNTATTTGGAIRSYMRSMLIEDSVFSHNSAPGAGAIGLHAGSPVPDPAYTVTMKYCTLYGNEATTDPANANGDGYGGAMLNIKTDLFLQNCIFWGNSAKSLYPATPDIWNASTSSMETWNTDMESLAVNHGSLEEVHHGSFSQDPLFEDPDGADNIAGTVDDNFRLLDGSPCIDQANDSYKTLCDLSPATRVVSSDVGAYEKFISPFSPTSCSSSVTCPAFPAISPPPVTPPTISPSSSSGKSLPSIFMLLLKK
ncbi:MAG: right-handed parallel beta-helix repeat-containing protein [Desulfocapsaceae bacterium]|nr:right-handed parallel beta-helix repeat-containing protein [Desulfocapsaceae bacterium]